MRGEEQKHFWPVTKAAQHQGKCFFSLFNPVTAGLRSASGGGIGDICPRLLERMGGKAAELFPR